mgnify:CR=1
TIKVDLINNRLEISATNLEEGEERYAATQF